MRAGIIGGGIMGKLLAYYLVNAGWQVSVFDKDNEQGIDNCSIAAAGLLTPISELEKAGLLIFNLGEDSLKNHWPNVIKSLPTPVYFKQNGLLILSHPNDKAEVQRFLNLLNSKVKREKLSQTLSAMELHKLEPELTKFNEACFIADEGFLDNPSLLVALKNYLLDKNVHWHANTVVKKIQDNQIIFETGSESFNKVFDCRGLGAKDIFPDLRGIRGELLWLHAPQVHINRPVRLMHPRYSIYIVPRPNQVYAIGASEIETEDHSDISVRTTLELLSTAFFVHPGFAEARLIKTITECRPTFPDHLPKIKFNKNLIAINGLYRHGFLIAPTLAQEVMRYLDKGHSALQFPEIWEEVA